MKSQYLFSFTVLALLLSGCGNSTEPTVPQKGISKEDNPPKKKVETIIGHVVDSPLWGLAYSCKGQKSKTTDKFGTFECEALPVTFKVGNLIVGHVSKMPIDKKVYPQDIIGVDRDKVEDEDVVELTRFFQTLDDDGNIEEAIKIEPSLAKEFVFKEEITLAKLDKNAVASMLQEKIGKNLVEKEAAQKHLRKNLVEGKKPTAIELSLNMSDIPKGLEGKAAVKGIYKIDDGEVKSILSKGVTFDSSDKTIATIDKDGKIKALGEGDVVISAKHGTFTTTYNLRVTHTTLTKIEIVKPTMAQLTALALGQGTSFRVKGFYSADAIEKDVTRQIIWSSKSPLLSEIAPISYSGIIASGTGKASLLATLFDLTDKIEFDIQKSDIKKIAIKLDKNKIPLGRNIYIRQSILGYYADDSNTTLDENITFSVDKENILEKRDDRFIAKEKGEATLLAKYKDLEKSMKITVVDPVIESINLHLQKYYDLHIGDKTKIFATGWYTDRSEEDITDKVIFKNLNPKIFSITPDGNITALKEGYGFVQAIYVGTDGNITSRESINIQKPYVKPVPTAIAISSGDSNEIPLGSSKRLSINMIYDNSSQNSGTSMNDDNIYWKIDNNDIARLDVNYGASLMPIKKGEVTVTAIYKDLNLTATKTFKVVDPVFQSIEIESDYSNTMYPTIYIGEEAKQFKVVARYSDGSREDINGTATWQVMSNIATVSNDGKVTGVSEGTTRLKATYKDKTVTTSVNVSKRVLMGLMPMNSYINIDINTTAQLEVRGQYSNGSSKEITQNLTWSSDNESIATVDSSGKVTAKDFGSTSIAVKHTDGASTSFKIYIQQMP